MLAQFNTTEYFSPSRRFILGALTHYEQPDKWVYEISPYDTADVDMIATAYDAIAKNTFIGDKLYFHPTSETVATLVPTLPPRVKVITTAQLFEGITYQPLNAADSYGQVHFYRAGDLSNGRAYLPFRDIAVLDTVPNDITVAMGIITDAFQTPLSHVNVLSKNRGTPNMALTGAFDDPDVACARGQVGPPHGLGVRLRRSSRSARPRPTRGGTRTSRRRCRCPARTAPRRGSWTTRP